MWNILRAAFPILIFALKMCYVSCRLVHFHYFSYYLADQELEYLQAEPLMNSVCRSSRLRSKWNWVHWNPTDHQPSANPTLMLLFTERVGIISPLICVFILFSYIIMHTLAQKNYNNNNKIWNSRRISKQSYNTLSSIRRDPFFFVTWHKSVSACICTFFKAASKKMKRHRKKERKSANTPLPIIFVCE